ncbi:hypothetical protein D9611_007140 [Ephemerocybe angulata]|uniref:Nephrocystin 3-like N-terminal domain-containing protein n=1 Tax=Ephemerocybe angulata TaxID=980116 RepID=A0A8H5B0S7_9AGAR|nr:hypothetical protein D9611_007140 [Tulosesus angulatus]
MTQLLNNAHDFSITNLNVHNVAGNATYNNRSSGKSALERAYPSLVSSLPSDRAAPIGLEENISAGAAHNSDERCDAPKCHPYTRVAVQDEIISWITTGDMDEEPKKILWLTGPAGTGKTAIAGSVAESCSEKGILAASFFFSSFSGSEDRRLKRCFVSTLAYQLRRHPSLSALDQHILSTIDHDPTVFRTRLIDQLEELILKPLRHLHNQIDASTTPKVIIIDGIDECEATNPFNRPMEEEEAQSIKEKDQLEILSLLLRAATDPCFPFRIVAVSRPERILSTFFSNATESTLELFLDDKYDPDSDIELFLQSKFAAIRRRYCLPPSWPTLEQIRSIVSNASGQFIYAATVVRFVEDPSNLPQKQLDRVLNLEKSGDLSKPFRALDTLYTLILNASPDPLSTVQWIWVVHEERVEDSKRVPALFWRYYMDSTVGEAERLLGCIPSLVSLPPPEDRTSLIKFYHKSLLDFIDNQWRCGDLWMNFVVRSDPDRRQYVRILKDQGLTVPDQDREDFLFHFLSRKPSMRPESRLELENCEAEDPHIEETLRSCDARWWVDMCLDNTSFDQVHRGLNATIFLHQVHARVMPHITLSAVVQAVEEGGS